MTNLTILSDKHEILSQNCLITKIDALFHFEMESLFNLHGETVPYQLLKRGKSPASLGAFQVNYEDAQLKEFGIKFYTFPVLLDALKMQEAGSSKEAINQFLMENISEVTSHEYGHYLQMLQFDNYYEEFYLKSKGYHLLDQEILFRHESFASLLLDKDFQNKATQLVESVLELERDANLFAVNHLKYNGLTEAADKVLMEYETDNEKILFVESYLIGRFMAAFEIIANTYFGENLSAAQLQKFAMRMSLFAYGLVSEDVLK